MKECPKCSSLDIEEGVIDAGFGAEKGVINFHSLRDRGTLIKIAPVSMRMKSFICLDCGYSESYVTKEDIEKLKNNFEYYKQKGKM